MVRFMSRLRRTLAQSRCPTFEQRIFGGVVRPRDVIYDIGANVGALAVHIAQLAGPTGLVVAFEPVPRTYVELCKRIQGVGSASAPIVPFPFGLTDVEARL